MKYYILSFLLLFSFGLKAQITYTPLSAAGYQIKYLKADSGFALPVVDTALMRNVVRPGLMVINPVDSLPYYYSGVKWKPVYVDSSGVIDLINNKVDSVTINGSTMFYWIAGLGYGTTINKIDSVTQSNDSVFTWINGVSTYSFQLTAGSGTVTQVIGGYGLVSDTITYNGILFVDTSVIAAKSWSTAQFAPISHTHSASDIISGTFPIARGGTGMSGIGAVGQLIKVAASGTALEYFTPTYILPADTSSMLSPYLRIVDTTNKWVADVTQLDDTTLRVIKGTSYADIVIHSASGGGGTWGSISGTLSSQTDLQSALNAKQDALTLTTTGTSGAATLIGNTLNVPQYSTDTTSLSNRIDLKLNKSDSLTVYVTPTQLKDSLTNYQRNQALTTLTDSSVVLWNYNTQSLEAKVTLAGNRTLNITNLPSNKVVYLTLEVIQDATGSRTLALPASTKVINGGAGAVTLTTTASATDILSFRWNGTTLYCTYGKNYN